MDIYLELGHFPLNSDLMQGQLKKWTKFSLETVEKPFIGESVQKKWIEEKYKK